MTRILARGGLAAETPEQVLPYLADNDLAAL